MVKATIIIVSVLALIGIQGTCDQQGQIPCDVDTVFQKQFTTNLQVMEKIAEGGLIDGPALTHSVIYLEDITLIPGHVIFGRYPYYESDSLLSVDINEWKGWFDQNKCHMNQRKADSLLKLQTISSRIAK